MTCSTTPLNFLELELCPIGPKFNNMVFGARV
ncbi:hypothetical protein Zm00014a_032318 [Zea mays]|uniref:Uncharacterized protein n=1 Tax=Zea mays TaxID=4577 RepID=A0A3L6D960_MAIZE|nr:hypothetical protein Zm00014a_032318 [Zea mays]